MPRLGRLAQPGQDHESDRAQPRKTCKLSSPARSVCDPEAAGNEDCSPRPVVLPRNRVERRPIHPEIRAPLGSAPNGAPFAAPWLRTQEVLMNLWDVHPG